MTSTDPQRAALMEEYGKLLRAFPTISALPSGRRGHISERSVYQELGGTAYVRRSARVFPSEETAAQVQEMQARLFRAADVLVPVENRDGHLFIGRPPSLNFEHQEFDRTDDLAIAGWIDEPRAPDHGLDVG